MKDKKEEYTRSSLVVGKNSYEKLKILSVKLNRTVGNLIREAIDEKIIKEEK